MKTEVCPDTRRAEQEANDQETKARAGHVIRPLLGQGDDRDEVPIILWRADAMLSGDGPRFSASWQSRSGTAVSGKARPGGSWAGSEQQKVTTRPSPSSAARGREW